MSEDVKTTWNAKASEWVAQAENEANHFTRRSRVVAELVARHLRGGTALDVGCGTGTLCERLREKGFDVYGTDLSEEMVAYCTGRFESLVPGSASRFRLCGSATLPFEEQTFDLVACVGVLNYVADWRRHLELMRLRLCPGGHIVLMCTNPRSLFVLTTVLHHFIRFPLFLRSNKREWVTTLGNLVRTGIWSGGHVDRGTASQCYSAASLDRLCAAQGLSKVDEVALYRCGPLDRAPLERGRAGQSLARRLGWNYCALYVDKTRVA